MIGQRLGHYVIVEKIGAGGMGEVYRARDQHLGRDVAIKVLPAGTLADDSARRRFRDEAEALARLNHPHIATIHDFATQDGTDFLVMEFVPGSSLADRLAGGSLPEKEVLRLGMQIAAALQEAHENRIVHRDLKPANIRLTAKGDAKVLDFGLAKLLRPMDEINTQSLTQSQAVAGTLPYMAPEQLRGEPVDARADIYALGCVLYEIATGRRPFRAERATELSSDILNKLPMPPVRLNPELSVRLEDIILKCLEKDPENRYQSAKELLVDLRRLSTPTLIPHAPSPQAPAWGKAGSALPVTVQPSGFRRWRRYAIAAGGLAALVVGLLLGFNLGGLRDRLFTPATPKIDSLAVLPLENLSGDPGQEYFADGMTETLITELSRIRTLKVISRTSVMRYKQADKPPLPEIARQLGVEGVVEGSVLRVGNRVRVTVQLIHARTDTHLWADNYDRDLRDVLALHSEVARAIAREIRATLTPAEQTRLTAARPVNPEAYEAYLRGRYYAGRRDIKKSLDYFQEALAVDGSYASAYAGVAQANATLGDPLFGVLPPKEAYPRARAAAEKALELDPSLSEAHAALGQLEDRYNWNWPVAEKEFKRALELNPSDASAYHSYALYLTRTGRIEEALAEMKRAQQLDPLSPHISTHVGWEYYVNRRCDEALKQLQKSLKMEPSDPVTHWVLGLCYLQKGRNPEAIVAFQKAVKQSARYAFASYAFVSSLGYAYAVSGNRTGAVKILEQLKEESKRTYVPSAWIAVIYAGLGEKDQAFAWLEKAYEDRSLLYPKIDPMFDPLRSDPRFQNLLRRMNFPEN